MLKLCEPYFWCRRTHVIFIVIIANNASRILPTHLIHFSWLAITQTKKNDNHHESVLMYNMECLLQYTIHMWGSSGQIFDEKWLCVINMCEILSASFESSQIRTFMGMPYIPIMIV